MFLEDVLAGLRERPRSVPCKYLYDARGSQLFDRICELDEYYLTRTETRILRENAARIAAELGPGCLLIEYGSGSSHKTTILLDATDAWAGYVPIDISRGQLARSAERLRRRYPGLEVLPVCADYLDDHEIPTPKADSARRIVFFPGSSIGNFERPEAEAFLRHMGSEADRDGGILIGVDLHKDTATIEAAYDDAQGVSAAFALNLLERMNRELGADFELERFGYDAFYDEAKHRVVMSIQSLQEQTVRLAGCQIELAEGERIRTEYAYKYTLDDFAELAGASGLRVEQTWTDPRELFSVQLLALA